MRRQPLASVRNHIGTQHRTQTHTRPHTRPQTSAKGGEKQQAGVTAGRGKELQAACTREAEEGSLEKISPAVARSIGVGARLDGAPVIACRDDDRVDAVHHALPTQHVSAAHNAVAQSAARRGKKGAGVSRTLLCVQAR